jgi:hypothetical protein
MRNFFVIVICSSTIESFSNGRADEDKGAKMQVSHMWLEHGPSATYMSFHHALQICPSR